MISPPCGWFGIGFHDRMRASQNGDLSDRFTQAMDLIYPMILPIAIRKLRKRCQSKSGGICHFYVSGVRFPLQPLPSYLSGFKAISSPDYPQKLPVEIVVVAVVVFGYIEVCLTQAAKKKNRRSAGGSI